MIVTTCTDGSGLPRDHRLVELGLAFDDLSVGGNAPTGAHEHDIAGSQLIEANRGERAVVLDPFRLVREEGGQGAEGVRRLPERLHLLPVPEQHDRDEGGQLPPDVDAEPSE